VPASVALSAVGVPERRLDALLGNVHARRQRHLTKAADVGA
jgi:hypothetical protein